MPRLVWAVRKRCSHHHHFRFVPHSRQRHHDLRHHVGGISCFSPCLVSLRGSLSRHCLAEMCHFGIPIIRPISFLLVLNSKESLFVCDPFRKESPYLSQGRYFANGRRHLRGMKGLAICSAFIVFSHKISSLRVHNQSERYLRSLL